MECTGEETALCFTPSQYKAKAVQKLCEQDQKPTKVQHMLQVRRVRACWWMEVSPRQDESPNPEPVPCSSLIWGDGFPGLGTRVLFPMPHQQGRALSSLSFSAFLTYPPSTSGTSPAPEQLRAVPRGSPGNAQWGEQSGEGHASRDLLLSRHRGFLEKGFLFRPEVLEMNLLRQCGLLERKETSGTAKMAS